MSSLVIDAPGMPPRATRIRTEPVRLRVNVGCGLTPTPGWRNFDNSPAVRLARFPRLCRLLRRLRALDAHQFTFAGFARENGVEYGDAVHGLPLASDSVDALYASHVLEHLDRGGANRFLGEARRVLADGGILRLAVPDLRLQAARYLEWGDADRFVAETMLAAAPTQSLPDRLKVLLMGNRHHQWMYDGDSLAKLVRGHGFREVRIVAPGETAIEAPGALDLRERAEESVYVEGMK